LGSFLHEAFFGGAGVDTLTSLGDFDAYVAKYSDTGNLLWDTAIGSTGHDYGSGVSSDAHGNTYVTGDIHISPFQFSSSKVFIGKFSPHGATVWLQKAGAGSGYCGGIGIDIDAMGNSYVTGYFHGSISFGSLQLSSSNGMSNELFVAKCDVNGAYQWAVKPDGIGQGEHVSVTEAGECYVSGTFYRTLRIGTSVLSNAAYSAIFLSKADTMGHFVTANQIGGVHNANLGECKASSQGVYVSGNFLDNLILSPSISVIGDTSSYNLFVAKMNAVTEVDEPSLNDELIIYPNPTSDRITIVQRGTLGADVEILNSIGERVLRTRTTNQQTTIDVSSQPTGIYVVRMWGRDGTATNNTVVIE